MTGTQLITAERERQEAVEGWTPEHDDAHAFAEMVAAACCYGAVARRQANGTIRSRAENIGAPSGWPWEQVWWKPSDDPIRNLVKAGALIAAEIDRLQRLKPCPVCGGSGFVAQKQFIDDGYGEVDLCPTCDSGADQPVTKEG